MRIKNQADLTRKALQDSARGIVAEFGAIHCTLEAVALRADVSRGALLYHFPTKEGLVEAMVRDLVEPFSQTCSALMCMTRNPGGGRRAPTSMPSRRSPRRSTSSLRR